MPETSTTGNNLKFFVNAIFPAKPTAIALKIIAIKNVITTRHETPDFNQEENAVFTIFRKEIPLT